MKPSTKIRTLYKQIKKLKEQLATSVTRQGRMRLREDIKELESEIRELKKDNLNGSTD